jgi:hypothetical protein
MPGSVDPNGVYIYAEDDIVSPFSDYMNLGQESVSESIADHYASLASRITDLEEDSGWLSLTLADPWANYGGSYEPAAVRRKGDRLRLRGMVRNSSALTGSTAYNIGTLPDGFPRPPYNLPKACATGNWTRVTGGASTGTAHTHTLSMVDTSVRVDLTTGGAVNLTLANTDTFPASGWIALDAEWWLD